MAYLIIFIPAFALSILAADTVAEKIARIRLRKRIDYTRENASAAIINNFSILH